MSYLEPAKNSYYDINKSYEENYNQGPFITKYPPVRDLSKLADNNSLLFGYKLNTKLGIAAGPLLNGKYVLGLAKCGFDLLTYKTVRSTKYACHPAPNCVYVDTKGQIPVDKIGSDLIMKQNPPTNIDDITITNSFGMPSEDPAVWQKDVAETNAKLGEGQLMIVSVVGTSPTTVVSEEEKQELFIKDFAKVAKLAKEAGAKVIEANFSCPNVKKDTGAIYTNPEISSKIIKAIKQEIGDIPLLVKVGFFADYNIMKTVIEKNIEAGANGFCGINTLSMKVYKDELKNDAALPLGVGNFNRLTAGLCGAGIKDRSLEFIINFKKIVSELNKKDIILLTTGGITKIDDIEEREKLGVDGILSTTGSMWNYNLAYNYYLKLIS